MFFDIEPSMSGLDVENPDCMQGISGSPIWKITKPDVGEFWHPSKTLKVVGVQTDYRKEDFLGGKKWDWVQGILNRI